MTDFELIHEQWHRYARARDVAALADLYAQDAVFESPLVPAILDQDSGVLRGRPEILRFLQEGTKRRPNDLVRWYRTGHYFTSGDTLVWEYPRQTPDGQQIDILEVMQITEGKISRHRIYWGWFGCRQLMGSAVRKALATPDDTAVRTALWRALHLQADPLPHVFEDDIGLKLIAPDASWRNRPDMGALTKPFRAAILARARFIEDLVIEQVSAGVGQYVLLGAGLDTFAQRRPEFAARLRIFELDQPAAQEWKRRRLVETGLGVAPGLRLDPVDFEAGDDWWQRLIGSGFDPGQPAVVSCTGVSMYLTRATIMDTLRQMAALAPSSTLAMSFLLPIEMLDADVRVGVERAAASARADATPWISFFMPDEMLRLARDAGFARARHVSAATLAQRYFAGRTDGLRPPDNFEELLVATT